MRTIEQIRQEMKENDVARSALSIVSTKESREAYKGLFTLWLELRAEYAPLRSKELIEEEKQYVCCKDEFTPTFSIGDVVLVDSNKHKQLKPLDKMALTVTKINENRNCCDVTCTGKGYLNGMTYTFAFDALKKVESTKKEESKEESKEEALLSNFFHAEEETLQKIHYNNDGYAYSSNGLQARKIHTTEGKDPSTVGNTIASFFANQRLPLSLPKMPKTGKNALIVIHPDRVEYTGLQIVTKTIPVYSYGKAMMETRTHLEKNYPSIHISHNTGATEPIALNYTLFAEMAKTFKKEVTICLDSANRLIFSNDTEGEGLVLNIRYDSQLKEAMESAK